MELNDPTQTFESFEKAIAENKNDPDIFYHRGQGVFRVASRLVSTGSLTQSN